MHCVQGAHEKDCVKQEGGHGFSIEGLARQYVHGLLALR